MGKRGKRAEVRKRKLRCVLGDGRESRQWGKQRGGRIFYEEDC